MVGDTDAGHCPRRFNRFDQLERERDVVVVDLDVFEQLVQELGEGVDLTLFDLERNEFAWVAELHEERTLTLWANGSGGEVLKAGEVE